MPEKQIQNWLIINWEDESTRTRKSEPNPSSLGTHEIATEVHLDVVIPDVQVDELHAKVEVPQPRVEATELEDVDAEDVPGWQEIADDYLETIVKERDDPDEAWYDEQEYIFVSILEDAPGRPDIEDVKRYCNTQIREFIKLLEEA